VIGKAPVRALLDLRVKVINLAIAKLRLISFQLVLTFIQQCKYKFMTAISILEVF
jgi:hypothetical protein